MKLQKIALFVKRNFNVNMFKVKIIVKFEIIVIILGNIKVLLIAYVI